MTIDGQQARLTALAALKDPLDRRCFDLVASDGGAVGRDEIAEALGLPRASAAFRLDRLVEVGLLDVEFRRRSDGPDPALGDPRSCIALCSRSWALQCLNDTTNSLRTSSPR